MMTSANLTWWQVLHFRFESAQPGITKLVISQMPELTIASNDACGMEKARNRAFQLASEGSVNWEKSYIREVLHVTV